MRTGNGGAKCCSYILLNTCFCGKSGNDWDTPKATRDIFCRRGWRTCEDGWKMTTLFQDTVSQKMALRPYQDDAFEKIIKGFVEYDRQLGVAPTGCGKTIIFCALARHFHNIGQRTLILCHREELVQQAADKLFRSTGLEADVDKAESYADHGAPVVVGSIQTLMRGKRRERWAAEHF